MADLTERLLGENFEEALGWIENSGEVGIPCEEVTMTYPRAVAEMAAAIRELHRLLATAKAEGAAAREDVAQLEKWLNEDPEMRLAEVLVGESYRWCVRLEQLVFDEPGSVKFSAEAGTFSEALRAAIDAARAGGGR